MGTYGFDKGLSLIHQAEYSLLKIKLTSAETLTNRVQLAAKRFATGVESAFAGLNMNMSVA